LSPLLAGPRGFDGALIAPSKKALSKVNFSRGFGTATTASQQTTLAGMLLALQKNAEATALLERNGESAAESLATAV